MEHKDVLKNSHLAPISFEESGVSLSFQLNRLYDQLVELEEIGKSLQVIQDLLTGLRGVESPSLDCEVRQDGIVGRFKHANDVADGRINLIKDLIEKIHKNI